MPEQESLNYQPLTIASKLLSILLIFCTLFGFSSSAIAEGAEVRYGRSVLSPVIGTVEGAITIKDRLQQYPQWDSKPSVQFAKGDLEYPEWMAGTWNVESTLIDKVAPLAPDIVSPGFEDNDDYIDQAIAFQVRFGKEYFTPSTGLLSVFKSSKPVVVADRAFNGKKIAEAYLGEANVYQVKTDPDNPNQQITFLKGDRKLISKVTGRNREIPQSGEFVATEITQQLFRSPERLYLNEVETTSDYHLLDSGNIEAEQITAIYLSPQDPDYFTAGDRPVALYRYRLTLTN